LPDPKIFQKRRVVEFDHFAVATTAADNDDYLIYHKANGASFYDAV